MSTSIDAGIGSSADASETFGLPILAVTRDPPQMIDAINFVFDTLLFGGTALLVAGAMPGEG